jgi:outer membrane protein TolC
MSKRRLAIAIVAWAVGWSGVSRAEGADRLQPLADFVAASARTNLDAREATSVAEQRAAEVDVAWGRIVPTFTARGAYTHNQYEAAAAFGGPGSSVITITPLNQLDATLTLDVPLVDVSAWRRVSAASALSDAAAARAQGTRLDVKRSLARQYFVLVGARALGAAAGRTLAAAEANVAIVAQRRDAGTGADLDVERAAAEVDRSRQSVAEARYLEAIAARALESASGLRPGAGAEGDAARALEDDLHEEGPLARWEQGLGTPAIEAAALEARAADRNASAARSALLPVLSAVGQERFTNATGFSGKSASYSAGVALTWRLDLATIATIRAQDAGSRAAEARADRARQSAQDRVHDDWQTVTASIAKSRAARAQVGASEHAARLARERYESGRATQLEVIQAERDAFGAIASRIQADADLAYARTALRTDTARE